MNMPRCSAKYQSITQRSTATALQTVVLQRAAGDLDLGFSVSLGMGKSYQEKASKNSSSNLASYVSNPLY